MTHLHFVCEKEQITRETDCLIISKELNEELLNVLMDARNICLEDRCKDKERLGNISDIIIYVDAGWSKSFEVRIKPDEKEAK